MVETRSPDGRTWQVESERQRASVGGGKGLASVVVTVLLIVVIVFVARRSTGFAILFGIVLLIWGAERISNLTRPRIIARTDGPPKEHLVWKATGHSRRQTLEKRVIQLINAGNPENEPEGLELVEL